MNQEIKLKLEQAADALFEHKGYSFTPCDYAMRKGFLAGAKTILENPSEFGLVDAIKAQHSVCDVLSKNEKLATEVTHMHYQLAKYMEALERILQGNCSPTLVAKEALKQ